MHEDRPLVVLGFDRSTFGAYLAIATLQAIFIHANLRLRFGPLRWVVNTGLTSALGAMVRDRLLTNHPRTMNATLSSAAPGSAGPSQPASAASRMI